MLKFGLENGMIDSVKHFLQVNKCTTRKFTPIKGLSNYL